MSSRYITLLEDSAGRMDYIYNAITDIVNANESTVIVTGALYTY